MTKMAYAMVTYYGMSEKVGNLSFYNMSDGYDLTKPYSEKTAETIDKQVSKLVEKAYQEAINILSSHQEGLTMLANKLIEKEVIFSDDLEAIFGKRPWDTESNTESHEG